MNNLNILLIGDMASGKTSLLNAIIREYYIGNNPSDYEENVLYINSLKEQGINYYRNDVKPNDKPDYDQKDNKIVIKFSDNLRFHANCIFVRLGNAKRHSLSPLH